MTVTVSFLPDGSVPDEALLFVVIAAKYNGRHLFCRHRLRSTWECPGGHIEPGETPLQAAHRELYEETGCTAEQLEPVCVYAVSTNGAAPTHGMLFRVTLDCLGELPEQFEMASVQLFDSFPDAWTYPDIQPHLLKRAWMHESPRP